jgi:hypothetical protein
MFMGYASNHEGDCYRMWNPNTKKASMTCDIVLLNRMFFRKPTKPVHKTQSTDNEDLDSVQQDKRGGTITADFVTGDDNAATVESVDSSVMDTPVVSNNLGQSKYGRMYKPTTLAVYYQCLKDMDGEMEFTNVGANIEGGLRTQWNS